MRQPIACSNDGTIFRRFGPDDWRLVFAGPEWEASGSSPRTRAEIFYYMDSTKNDPRWIRGNAFSSRDYPVWSQDGGLTWECPPDYRGVSYLDRQFGWGAVGGGGFDYLKADDGTLYGISPYLGGGHSIVHRGTDRTAQAWQEVFDWTAGTGLGFFGTLLFMADGYFWWTRSGGGGNLFRMRPDGSGFAAFPILPYDAARGVYPVQSRWLRGFFGSHRLVLLDTFSDTTCATIDISDPDHPTLTSFIYGGVDEAFGENADQDFDVQFQDMRPVDNQVILAMTHRGSADDGGAPNFREPPGTLWRSADGGLAWAPVIPETYDLSHAGYYNEFNAISVDPDSPDRIVCGMAPPYVFISEDRGLTWTRETVDLSPAQAQGRNTLFDDQEWCSFAWGGPAVSAGGRARVHVGMMD